jgi:two-component system nitrate/nitrite response regulator NarL
VIGTPADGDDGVRLAAESHPDVCLVDIGLPDRSGLLVGAEIREVSPTTKLIALTALKDPRLVDEAIRIGFVGYIDKGVPVARFVESVRAVADGRAAPPRVVQGSRNGNGSANGSLIARQLTERETQVLRLMVDGLSGSQIATKLGISSNTVRTHIQSILTKLQVHSRLAAATFAVRHGLFDARRRTPGG